MACGFNLLSLRHDLIIDQASPINNEALMIIRFAFIALNYYKRVNYFVYIQ